MLVRLVDFVHKLFTKQQTVVIQAYNNNITQCMSYKIEGSASV